MVALPDTAHNSTDGCYRSRTEWLGLSTNRFLIRGQINAIEQARLARLEQAPQTRPNAMIWMLASIRGVGIETAEMLVQEVLSRNLRDRRAVGRYAGLTGAPDESGSKRREKGLTKSGNARVRRGLIQLAWRFLLFQKDSALAHGHHRRSPARCCVAGSGLISFADKERKH